MADDLLQHVAAGDQNAVAGVLDRYGGLVWSLARRFSSSQSDAEDAVQEIFVDLWKSAARYDPSVASEATFIAMIARRRLIDRRRRSARAPALRELNDSVGAGTAENPAHPCGEVGEEAAIALRALQDLRPEQQRVLRLSVFQGLSHERISEVTGLPLGTVKTHARRGLMRVREILGVKSDEHSVGTTP